MDEERQDHTLVLLPISKLQASGTFADIVGLVCGIFQCASAAIAYAFLSQKADSPIKISVWPLIFAFGVLCSRFPRNPRPKSALRRLKTAHPSRRGLQPPDYPSPSYETPLLFQDKNYYRDLSEIAEQAKRRAEVARLRELHTLKGHVELVARTKGLDIDLDEHYYSV
ncbi:hypothetical protein GH714_004516 [Hevea brasiliensis]|uniref:Uncharacterized protein n=1 Tax=Hevea brasiliensis TaxID=3981 RepID=A0A6A6KXK4_HEVBR|nr:hypothetical protein GH714_004516 [Hevea brasiliensis]